MDLSKNACVSRDAGMAGARQVPRPLQVPAVISRSPAQTGETQMVSGA